MPVRLFTGLLVCHSACLWGACTPRHELNPSQSTRLDLAAPSFAERGPHDDEAVVAGFTDAVGQIAWREDDGDEVAPEVYATLEAMLETRAVHEGCSGGVCKVTRSLLVHRTSESAPAPSQWPTLDTLTEVAVFGVSYARNCTWFVATRTSRGWLEPIQLGGSARDCAVPLDDWVLGNHATLWFPVAIQHDADAVRIEAQVVESEGLYEIWDDPKAVATINRHRSVTVCRIGVFGSGTLACSERDEVAPAIRTSAAGLIAAAPLAPGPESFPLREAHRVGLELPARWIIAPRAPTSETDPVDRPQSLGKLTETLSRYSAAAVAQVSLGLDKPTVLINRTVPTIGVFDAGRYREISNRFASFVNEELEVTAIHGFDGGVQVDLSRTVRGDTTVTWRWSELITTEYQVMLARGVEFAVDGKHVASWERKVSADTTGVTLSGGRGELAWFRGTGRYTWDELAHATRRWRLAFARAWEPVSGEPTRRADGRDPHDEFTKDIVGRVVTIPGFVEPVNWAVVDAVTPISSFE